jgi:hypothetical protein
MQAMYSAVYMEKFALTETAGYSTWCACTHSIFWVLIPRTLITMFGVSGDRWNSVKRCHFHARRLEWQVTTGTVPSPVGISVFFFNPKINRSLHTTFQIGTEENILADQWLGFAPVAMPVLIKATPWAMNIYFAFTNQTWALRANTFKLFGRNLFLCIHCALILGQPVVSASTAY